MSQCLFIEQFRHFKHHFVTSNTFKALNFCLQTHKFCTNLDYRLPMVELRNVSLRHMLFKSKICVEIYCKLVITNQTIFLILILVIDSQNIVSKKYLVQNIYLSIHTRISPCKHILIKYFI